jgi:hypothetical protein
MRWWVSVVPGTPAGNYQIPLTITLPCGDVETKTLKIKVVNGIPPTPNNILTFKNADGSYYVGLAKAANSKAYEWSLDNGQTWETVPNIPLTPYNIWTTHPFLPDFHPYQVNVCVRAKNCEVSPKYCTNVTIPAENCPHCRTALLPPSKIIFEPIANSANFTLKVKKSELSDAYDWSFDQDYWYKVENTTSEYNYFGEFEMSTTAFPIYVRARQQDTTSYIFAGQINPPLYAANGGQPEIEELIEIAADRERPLDSEGVLCSFTLTNHLGQVVKTGKFEELPFKAVTEHLPQGFYVLTKYSENMKHRVVTKIMITN